MWRKRLELVQCLAVLGLAAIAGCGSNSGTNANNGGANGAAQAQANATPPKAGVVPMPAKQIDEAEPNMGVEAKSESRLDPSASEAPSKLHERIIGKWTKKIGDDSVPVVAELTYEYTRDKQIITTVLHNTKPGLPAPPAVPKRENKYRVLNSKEVEVTTPDGHKERFTVTINNGELNMAGHKDQHGKLIVFKKVN